MECGGYCPDRAGRSTTFCVSGAALGQNVPGLCVAQAAAGNAFCDQWDGLEAETQARYRGRGGAPAADASVCMFSVPQAPSPNFDPPPANSNPPAEQPAPRASEPEPRQPEASEPEPEEPETDPGGNGGICDDPELPLSDHALPYPGVPENTWRCACSGSFERPVSQVCRSGAWVNYQLDPVDCGRCAGRYTGGCEPR